MRVNVNPETQIESVTYSIALLQGEAEMFHTPAYDVSPWLAALPQASLQIFTDRMVEALHELAPQFDCIVIGPNSIYTHDILPMLRDRVPRSNLLVLSQFSADDFGFLCDDLALTAKKLRSETSAAYVASGRFAEDEIVLNWPRPLLGTEVADLPVIDDVSAIRAFAFEPGETAWRPVLEVRSHDRSHPVVLRTRTGREPRIVVSELRLEPAKPSHRFLLENMLTYCAGGRPEIAVIERDPAAPPSGPLSMGGLDEAHVVTGKLRLQGASVVELHAKPGRTVPFARWPLKAVRQAVLIGGGETAEAILESPEAAAWMRHGGTLVTGDDDGRLRLYSGADDALWVAERWATWFRSTEPAAWMTRVHRCRAVLSTLAMLQTCSGLELDRLGLGASPLDFRQAVAEMLRGRVDRDNIDHTITTTAAALDLDELVGGRALARPDRLRGWLQARFDDASLEDRLEIARQLRDVGLFRRAVAAIGAEPLSARAQTRLRQAAVASPIAAGDLPEVPADALEHDHLLRELAAGRQLAAQYLEALVAFARDRRFEGRALSRLDGKGIDRAVTTLVESGCLRRIDASAAHSEFAEDVGAETRALLSFFSLSRENTLLIRPTGSELPFFGVQAVLREAERAQSAAAEALARARPVETARKVVGWAALAAAVLASLLAALLNMFGVVDLVPIVGRAAAAFSVVFIVLAYALIRLHVFPEKPSRLRQFAEAVAGGIVSTLRKAVGSQAGTRGG